MAALFHDRPDLLRNTEALAERLEFTLDDLGYTFPDYPVPPGESMFTFLCQATDKGARDRYRPYHEKARRQIERELALIGKLSLAGYFLIVWDIVNFCRARGILVQGRGSAANSAVCYSLGITAVDPVGMELLFERFLSEERQEWPDIDLDLPSGDGREEVIQHVYRKYGARGAAMTANVITYRERSAAREIGKVLEIPEPEIDRLARTLRPFEYVDPNDSVERRLREGGFDGADRRVQLFSRLFGEIQDLPRHLGQHSGGMVIAQGRLDDVVPLEPASMPGRVVVQWDKDDCADLHIVKVDLLGPGHDGRAAGLAGHPRERGHAGGPRAPAPRRPEGLRDAAGRGHRRRVPGGEPRADVHAAAHEAHEVLRPRGRGRDHPPRAHRGEDGPPVPQPARGQGARRLRAPLPGAGAEAHPRRAALPGAGDPHVDDGRRLHRRARRRSCAARWA